MPDGCLESQAGLYEHAQSPAFRYRAEDNGGTLTLVLDDGPPQAAPRVVLNRTSNGFVGYTQAQAFAPSGQKCTVTFSTSVKACERDVLVLLSAPTTAIDELCQVSAAAPSAPLEEQRLVRKPLDGADAG